MGFLVEAEPLTWSEALNKLEYVRNHGIEQFVHIFHQVKYLEEDLLRWGDEIEYAILKLVGEPGDENRTVKISLRSPEAINQLKELEKHGMSYGLSEADMCTWMPEFGRWMLEATPRKPYEGLVALLKVEDHMRLRRSRLLSVLKPGEIVPTVTSCPLFGVGDFCDPPAFPNPNSEVSKSLFMPDEVIYPLPRFPTLAANIRKRRGGKVAIRLPLYMDTNTPERQYGRDFIPETVEQADSMDHVYSDAMGFGMGCCCLQVTFQAANVAESRHLYDHLSVLTPIMLALTAATPFMRGFIVDHDCRWDRVAQSVDDRTPAERGLSSDSGMEDDRRLAGNGSTFLRKSRFGSISCYLCNCKAGKEASSHASSYNDLGFAFRQEHLDRLTKSGIDDVLSKHVAHLFSRDPLVIYKERIVLDDRTDVDHWENVQSTNWQNVRWKPPPPHKGQKDKSSEEHIGWRVEFRTLELQMTDFENAAFTVFVVLLSRVVLGLELNLYVPISKLDENMHIAQKREACTKEKFWFRENCLPVGVQSRINSKETTGGNRPRSMSIENSCTQMSIYEILTGTKDFPGLIPLCHTYLDFIGCDSVTRQRLTKYMDFIEMRAAGKILTPATWMRNFVLNHPSYNKDSRVPGAAAYDLMVACKEIGEGKRECPEILGDIKMPVVEAAQNPFRDDYSKDPLIQSFWERAQAKRRDNLTDQIDAKRREIEKMQEELRRLSEEAQVKAPASLGSSASGYSPLGPNSDIVATAEMLSPPR